MPMASGWMAFCCLAILLALYGVLFAALQFVAFRVSLLPSIAHR
jgi:hypothetical protein